MQRKKWIVVLCSCVGVALVVGTSLLRPASAEAPEANPEPVKEPTTTTLQIDTVTINDLVTLRNDAAVLGISAELGRITHFGAADGPSLMWLGSAEEIEKQRDSEKRTWINYGGDKVWTTLQTAWNRVHGVGGFPPDHTLDGAPWEVEKLSDLKVRMTSPVSPYINARVIRTVELDATKPRVVIHNTIERVETNPFPVHIWSVSQTFMPEYSLLGVTRERPQGPIGGEYHAMWGYGQKDNVSANITPMRVGDRVAAVRWDFNHKGGGKVGTLGTWCAAVFDEHVWVQHAAFDPEGGYPDASNMQVYTDGRYVELETLSPQVQLAKGQKLDNTVVWTLLPRDGRSDTELTAAIVELPGVE